MTEARDKLEGLAKFKTEYKPNECYYLTTCQCGWSMKTTPNDWGANISNDFRYVNHRIDHIEAMFDNTNFIVRTDVPFVQQWHTENSEE
jgi:hypothetical protein